MSLASYQKQAADNHKGWCDATALVEKIRKEHEVEKQNAKKLLKQGPYSDIDVGEYSDLKVKCFEKVFHLHRVVVCPQSRWFRGCLRPEGFKESLTGVVDFPEEDPHIFEMLVQLMYLRELDDGSDTRSNSDESPEAEPKPAKTAMELAQLYVMAFKYGGPESRKAAYKLVVPLLSEAFERATQASVKFIFSNIPVASDQLRRACVRIAAIRWRYLSVGADDIKRFLDEEHDFASELLLSRELFRGCERLLNKQKDELYLVELAQQFAAE